VLELLPEPALVLAPSGRVLRGNTSASTLLGVEPNALEESQLESWLASKLSSACDDGRQTLGASDITGSHVLRTAAGKHLRAIVEAHDIRLDDGRPGIVITLHQVGQAPSSEKAPGDDATNPSANALIRALQRNEERLAYATGVSQVGLFEHWFHPDPTAPPWWSPSMRALLGYDEKLPADFGCYGARIHPEDQPILDRAMARATDKSGDGRVVVEYRWRHPEKGYRWLSVRWATVLEEIDGQKTPVRALGAILDVTEQRVLEADRARRAAILEATPYYVAIADVDGRIVDLY
jgi:PAS domain-containing protein